MKKINKTQEFLNYFILFMFVLCGLYFMIASCHIAGFIVIVGFIIDIILQGVKIYRERYRKDIDTGSAPKNKQNL